MVGRAHHLELHEHAVARLEEPARHEQAGAERGGQPLVLSWPEGRTARKRGLGCRQGRLPNDGRTERPGEVVAWRV